MPDEMIEKIDGTGVHAGSQPIAEMAMALAKAWGVPLTQRERPTADR